MAKYRTRKNGDEGKRHTLSRRAQRAAKYHTPAADLKRLQEELRQQQKERGSR